MGFSAVMSGGRPPDRTRALPGIALARAACRDPDPGLVGPALQRIDALLAGAEQLIGEGGDDGFQAFGLMMTAGAIAATEPVGGPS